MLGPMIKRYRQKANLTQLQLARNLGFGGPQYIHLIEKGLSKPSQELLGKLIVMINLPEKTVVNIVLKEYRRYIKEEISKGKSLQKNR